MFRLLARITAGLTVAATLITVASGPAAAYYDPGVPGWPPKPTIPKTTSVAVDVANLDVNQPSYWTLIDNQGVTAGGNASLFGSPSARASFATIVPTPTGKGYWTVSAIGGEVDSFGDAWKAPNFTTTGYSRYAGTVSISDAAPMPDGQGLVAVDISGHVWTLGSARAYGDVTKGPVCVKGEEPAPIAIRMNKDGSGYFIAGALGEVWVRGANVGVYGDSCAAGQHQTITSMAPTPDFRGYWLTDYQGKVHAYGDAPANVAGTLTNPTSPVTYLAALPTGGYLLAHENGAVDVFKPSATSAPPPRHHCHKHGHFACPR